MRYWKMIAVSVLAWGAPLSITMAQGTMTGAPGNWTVHTAAKAGCPGIALQVQREGNSLKGFAETGDMADASRLAGTIDSNGHFAITISQIDGKGPQGTITGSRNRSDGSARGASEGVGLHRWTDKDRDLCAYRG